MIQLRSVLLSAADIIERGHTDWTCNAVRDAARQQHSMNWDLATRVSDAWQDLLHEVCRGISVPRDRKHPLPYWFQAAHRWDRRASRVRLLHWAAAGSVAEMRREIILRSTQS